MQRFAFLLQILLLAGCAAMPADTGPVFSPDAIRAHVSFLADDLLEGRETGTRGFDLAAHYIASQFAELGLAPAGADGDWFMPVDFQVRTIDAGASVTISGPGGEQTWANGTDAALRPSATERQQDREADLVFVGFGIDEPRVGIDDYAGLDVRGKFVVTLLGYPRGMNSEVGAHLASVKEDVAARHGALGMVTLGTIQSEQTTRSWDRRVQSLYNKRMGWMEPDGRPHVEGGDLIAGIYLNGPASAALFNGAPMSFDDVRAVADRVGGMPKGFPLQTRLRVQRTSQWQQVSSENIAARIEGSDPALKDEYVVLMGHADHLGIHPDEAGDNIYNGTLDNAAGTATLLEVAKAVVESGKPPRRSILFIASTGEEKGLLGADYFAHYPSVPIEDIVGLVDLDMPYLLYDFADVVAYGADHSTMGAIVRRAAARMDVALSPDNKPEEGIFTRSDHYMFVKQGVPAVMLAIGPANGGGEKQRDFLANRYHQPSDDMAQAINWASGAKFAHLNYLITREMADSDQRPLWLDGDYFGDTFAPDQPRARQ